MLTDCEQEEVDRCRVAGEHVPRAVVALLAIIDRLTTPRAVLGEADRLLRRRKVEYVDFHYECPGDGTVDGVVVEAGDRHGISERLADAYEALKEGE